METSHVMKKNLSHRIVSIYRYVREKLTNSKFIKGSFISFIKPNLFFIGFRQLNVKKSDLNQLVSHLLH